jgi:hypothetical protein
MLTKIFFLKWLISEKKIMNAWENYALVTEENMTRLLTLAFLNIGLWLRKNNTMKTNWIEWRKDSKCLKVNEEGNILRNFFNIKMSKSERRGKYSEKFF